jgi:hypothetical protein
VKLDFSVSLQKVLIVCYPTSENSADAEDSLVCYSTMRLNLSVQLKVCKRIEMGVSRSLNPALSSSSVH